METTANKLRTSWKNRYPRNERGGLKKTLLTLCACGCFLLLLGITSCNQEQAKTQLTVFHAGSLSIPMKAIEAEYEKLHPHVDIVREASGSRKAARKISDLNRDCDLFLSADYRVIDNLLIPEYADHLISFADNSMVIAYNENSRYASEISVKNWSQILIQKDVRYGRTDPDLDPCGYRTLFLFQLQSLRDTFFYAEMLGKDQQYVRSTEAELSALLESGELDYLFLYKSVAQQHKLQYIELSDSLNLSNPHLNPHYAQVKVKLSGKQKNQDLIHSGASITYGLCIPKASSKKALALDFTAFILNENQGMHILQENGQNPLKPEIMSSDKTILDSLKTKLLNE